MTHTKESLQRDLETAGIRPDDTLLIHSSMKSIGQVAGGADTVLDALMEYFQDEGLLVLPSLSYSLVNAEQPIFDVTSTPSVVGLLPEMFRKRPGVCRSLHPTHSVAAWGKDARDFVSGHEHATSPAPWGSPWSKLVTRQAKILFIGTKSMHCNTFLHGVEEWFGVPGMLTDVPQNLVAIDEQGNRHPMPMRRHLGGHSSYYEKMRPHFEKAGILSQPHFGDAACFLIPCAETFLLTLKLLHQDPLYFTHD